MRLAKVEMTGLVTLLLELSDEDIVMKFDSLARLLPAGH